MKICVLGAGAMGSVYGAMLARAGNEVWLVDRWAAHIEAIGALGLAVSGASGEWTATPQATTDPAAVGTCDLLIAATKTRDLGEALRQARPAIGERTLVLTIQNGLGAADIAEGEVGAERTLVGIAGGFGASIPAPGHVHHNGWEQVRLGSRRPDGLANAERVAAIWEAAGFRVEAVGDIESMIWSKLICNVAYSAVCCVTGLTIGAVMESEDARQLSASCAQEAFAVAGAKGIALPFTDPVAHVLAFGRKIPDARPSLLLDRIAGRPSEIDNLNGAVAAEGPALGVAVATNAALAALVRTMEALDLRPPAHGAG